MVLTFINYSLYCIHRLAIGANRNETGDDHDQDLPHRV